MTYTLEILNSKIAVPSVENTVNRASFSDLVKDFLKYKLILITAGAGYGKSTIAAQAGKFLRADTIWYRIDQDDNDFTAFIQYIIAGFRKIYPGLGEKTLSKLNPLSGGVQKIVPVLTTFITELEKNIKKESLIILDDFHLVSNVKDINESILFFLNHLPQNIHIVITCRKIPAMPLSRYRARLEVLDVTQSDLEFSVQEISQLYSRLFGFKIPHEHLLQLKDKTEGWAAGLILFYHYSKGKKFSVQKNVLNEIKGTTRIFSDYMGENVYPSLAEDIQDFLLNTSVFPRLEVEFIDKLLETDNSGKILKELEERHLFTNSIDEARTCFCYHHLFQNFLVNKFIEVHGVNAVRNIHLKAAKIYEKKNKADAAIIQYIEAEEYNFAINILSTSWRQICLEGRISWLDSVIKKFPDNIYETDPWILSIRSYILATSAKLHDSVALGRVAYKKFITSNNKQEAITILNDTGRVYYTIGDFVKAEEIFSELINQSLPFNLKVVMLGHLILTSAYLKKAEKSDIYFREAINLIEQNIKIDSDETKNLYAWIYIQYGFRFYFTGNFTTAVEQANKAYQYLNGSNFYTLLSLYYQLQSTVYFFKGDCSAAMELAHKGLSLNQEKGYQDTQKAWLLIVTSSIFSLENKIDEAFMDVNEAQLIFRKGGCKWGEALSCIVLSILHSSSGDINAVRKNIAEGLSITNDYYLPAEEGKLNCFFALGMIEMGLFDQAEISIEKAETLLAESEFESCFITFLRAFLFFKKKDISRCCKKACEALEVCLENDYGLWFSNVQEWIIPVLVSAYSTGKYRAYIINLFKQRKHRFRDEIKKLLNTISPEIDNAVYEILSKISAVKSDVLTIFCLGRFRVFVGDKEILMHQWKSKKALEIFKYLALAGEKRYVHKEVLMELLWPEESSEKTSKRLHVALPALRKTLEPDLKRGSNFLIRVKDSYRLEKGHEGSLDVEEFIRTAKTAEKEPSEKALKRLLKAENLYQGDLLSEDIYSEWIFEKREKLRSLYDEIIKKIIFIYKEKNEIEKCIKYSNKLLEHDPYDEKMYRELMKFYAETGNSSMIIKTYNKCTKYISEELACPLEASTTNLYNKLVLN